MLLKPHTHIELIVQNLASYYVSSSKKIVNYRNYFINSSAHAQKPAFFHISKTPQNCAKPPKNETIKYEQGNQGGIEK